MTGRKNYRGGTFNTLAILLPTLFLLWVADYAPGLLLAIVTGGILPPVAVLASKAVKKLHGRVLFPFQTTIFVLASLILASMVTAWK